MAALWTVALLFSFSSADAAAAATALRLERDLDASLKERPVMKVVRMLQDMGAELQEELDDDKKVYDMLTCWCKNNDQEKTQAIELGTGRISDLKASLGEDAAKVREMKAKRAATMDEIDSDQKALDTATEMRLKENKAFHGEETDLVTAVDACKQAIVVLGEHHPALNQMKSVAGLLKRARVQELALSSAGKLGRAGAQALKDFMQGAESASSFLAVPGYQSYRPQSGQVFGILKQMQADFSSSLSEAQQAEAKAKAEFENVRAAKQAEIAAGKSEVVQLDADIAALGEKAAQEAKELKSTEDQLGLDQEFLANLKTKCTSTDAEYEARTKSRLEEIAAVEDTIKILNADESFDVFGKSLSKDLPPAFLQTSSRSAGQTSEEATLRSRAAALLVRAAGRSGLPRLALIAASAQLDAFTKVKEEIDKLVAELKSQQKDEVAHRDWCTEELAANKRSTAAGYDKKASLETKASDLEKLLESLGAKISETDAAASESQTQMKRSSEVREAENADFQQTIRDQRLTQAILQKALGRMKQVYGLLQQRSQEEEAPEQPGAAHTWTSGNHTDPGNGPARFKEKELHTGGSRVVAMIEKVITDSKETEDKAIQSEEDAQKAYEDFMKESNTALIKYAETKLGLSEAKAKAKASLSMTNTDLKGNMKELESLNSYLGDLNKSCDFLLKNFEARQEARTEEMQALGEAKAILSGMQ